MDDVGNTGEYNGGHGSLYFLSGLRLLLKMHRISLIPSPAVFLINQPLFFVDVPFMGDSTGVPVSGTKYYYRTNCEG